MSDKELLRLVGRDVDNGNDLDSIVDKYELKYPVREIIKSYYEVKNLNHHQPIVGEHNKFSKIDLCVDLAKRNIIDNIYRSARLEGINTTFMETEKVYEGMEAVLFKPDDIITIINLKHAWQFLFETLDVEPSYNYICQIHKYVGSSLYRTAGFIRNLPVGIGGTSWKPAMPIESVIKETIERILKIEDPTERALSLMTYLMRSQIFIDGNKRTSMLIANQILISTGTGILSIPVELIDEFKALTLNFYETNDNTALIRFFKDKCIEFIKDEWLDYGEQPQTNSDEILNWKK